MKGLPVYVVLCGLLPILFVRTSMSVLYLVVFHVF